MKLETIGSMLDGISALQLTNSKRGFPEHFHDAFSISLIEEGLEAIAMGANHLYTEKGLISINNPYEVHSNPIVGNRTDNKFTTLYLSPDLTCYLLKSKGVNFDHQQSIDENGVASFYKIIRCLRLQKIDELQTELKSLLSSFKIEAKARLDDLKTSDSKWSELLSLIDHSVEKKISLEFLAKSMSMDKYHFSKIFRKKHGLSPMNYYLMKKVFRARDEISKTSNLTQIAYQFGFYDQPHFSRQFKRFVGLSPNAYKRQL